VDVAGSDSDAVRELDRLSLGQALRDFEVANARVVDLTRRLTTMNRELIEAQKQIAKLKSSVTRLETASKQPVPVRTSQGGALRKAKRFGGRVRRRIRPTVPR
jgi:hypothetical protein